jgi:hypothetical protein
VQQSVTKFIPIIDMNLVTLKAAAKREPLFKKPASSLSGKRGGRRVVVEQSRKQALRATRRLENNSPNFLKSCQNISQAKKCQNIYIDPQFESPKHLHRMTFETLKYLQ